MSRFFFFVFVFVFDSIDCHDITAFTLATRTQTQSHSRKPPTKPTAADATPPAVNILFGVYLIKRIHGFYRTRGMTMDQARSEAITDVANADATRAAGRAGADWAKSDEGRAAIRAAATSEAGQAAIREGVRSAV